MLPPHRTKLERITDHVAAVSEDLRDYVELRVALVKRQIEGVIGIIERVQHLVEAAKLAIPGVILLILGALFLLVTIALFLGQLLDNYGLGFLIVTLVLLVAGGVLVWLAKRRYDAIQEEVARAKREQRNAESASRDELEDAQRRRVQQAAV
ncbi:phage holin family protein [Rubrivirga sp.]|uniref:phage holin family protein n=1 Tax=Rubrivirga sp. TaxID=1885344 RepID=UPI003C791351